VADDSRARSERVIKAGMIFLGVLTVVGLIALVVSLPKGGDSVATSPATASIDRKAQIRASNEAIRVARALSDWAKAVDGVCQNGQVAFPAIKYGFAARTVDSVAAVNSLVNGVDSVALPTSPTASGQLAPVRTQGADLTKLWNDLGKRKKELPDLEKAAAVDQARAYVQTLIDRGAKDCLPLLPAPNPPLQPAPDAAVPAG
jgi:hypothetical protein